MNFPLIYCKETKEKGRGVFSASEITENTVIERCPVILITSAAEINLIACTSIINYAFRWSAEENIVTIALGYGSLYNHASANNAMYKIDAANNTIDIIALRTIKPGEEITISYVAQNGTTAKTWFEDRGIEYIE